MFVVSAPDVRGTVDCSLNSLLLFLGGWAATIGPALRGGGDTGAEESGGERRRADQVNCLSFAAAAQVRVGG